MDRLQQAGRDDNVAHADDLLSFSIGAATWRGGEPLDAVVRRADIRMYRFKRRYYSAHRIGPSRGERSSDWERPLPALV